MSIAKKHAQKAVQEFYQGLELSLEQVIQAAIDEAAQSAAVPVVGEVVAYMSADGDIEYSEKPWMNTGWQPLIIQPTTSITAAELREIAELACPEAYGFEGPDTFPECGKCVVCRSRALVAAIAGEKKW